MEVSEEIPIPTTYSLPHIEIKVNRHFTLYQTLIRRGKSHGEKKFYKIFIDFFIRVVYDKIAKYRMPIKSVGVT